MNTNLILLISLAVDLIVLIILLLRKRTITPSPELQQLLFKMEAALTRMEAAIKDEFRNNRAENATLSKENRMEFNNTLVEMNKAGRESLAVGLKDFTFEQRNKFDDLKNEQKELRNRTVEQLEKINEKLALSIREFQESFDKNMVNMNNLQREKFQQLETRQEKLIESTEKKLEEMRATVDEKLQKTLSERIGQSFEIVGKQLESVQKGLGEMQTIAQDVGGLKKVLSNVKLRGGVGEVQLAMLLEQILAPNQYDANVKTKAGSSEPVEFAIKLPGRSEEENSFVYLPIDAKFPKDVYETLINAYENAVPEDIEAAAKAMESTIRKLARDIRDKYIDPPNTTDFAILFLPFEGIYAEVIRRTALVDQLRDEFKITVAGPTTLVALLNSLQMGFRTLALQKRSSEVWKVLGAVKTEFEKFGGLLEKAQKNLHSASDTVDELLGKRSRAITRRLKNVEALPAAEAQQLLPDINNELLEEDE